MLGQNHIKLKRKFLVRICLKQVGFSITLWSSLIMHRNEHRINWVAENGRDHVAEKQKV